MGNKKLSVIICTYNRCKLLEKTLLSFKSQNYTENIEIIVIDNNSSDDTYSIVSNCRRELYDKLEVRYYLEKKQGLAIARNTGIRVSTGEIIAFLDDDAIPSENWISSIISAFDSFPFLSAIGGKVEPLYEIDKPEWLDKEMESFYSIVNLGDDVTEFPFDKSPVGANMAFRREVFEELEFPVHLGRKGNSLISYEETWVFNCLRKRGHKIYYIPRMSVKHFIPRERLNQAWIKERYYADGLSVIYSKDNSIEKFVLILFSLIKIIVLNFLKFMYKQKNFLFQCKILRCKGIIKGAIYKKI